MNKLVVLGLRDRDYHYSNVSDFQENGTYLVITCKLQQDPTKTIVVKHPIKQIAGWIVDKD